MGQYKDFKEIQDLDHCWLLGVVAKVKIGVILLNKQEIGNGKYSKISNNCALFESNRILK